MEPIYATGVAARLRSDWDHNEGLGQNDRALKFLCQDFESLRSSCLQNSHLYQDETFPAQPSSLGFKELAPGSTKTKGVCWMRPTVRSCSMEASHKLLPCGASVAICHIQTPTNLIDIPVTSVPCLTHRSSLCTPGVLYWPTFHCRWSHSHWHLPRSSRYNTAFSRPLKNVLFEQSD